MQRDDAAYWDQVEEAAELLQEGRFGEALTHLRDVIRAHPENPYAFHHAGIGMFETGQFEAARDAFRAAVRLAPDFLGARVALRGARGRVPGAERRASHQLHSQARGHVSRRGGHDRIADVDGLPPLAGGAADLALGEGAASSHRRAPEALNGGAEA